MLNKDDNKNLKPNNYRTIAYSRYEKEWKPSRFTNYYNRKLKMLNINHTDHCLDIGCGFGNFLHYYSGFTRNFIGIDSSSSAIDHVHQYFGINKGDCVDVLNFLKEDKRSWNYISAIDFLEHLTKSELIEVLSQVSSKLSPQGTFIVRMPNPNGIFGMQAAFNDITHELNLSWSAFTDIAKKFQIYPKHIFEDGPSLGNLYQTLHFIAWKSVSFPRRITQYIEDGLISPSILTKNFWWIGTRK